MAEEVVEASWWKTFLDGDRVLGCVEHGLELHSATAQICESFQSETETLLLTVLANPGAATSDDLALDLAKLLESTCVRGADASEVSRNQEQSQTTARD
ncbi:hypothetical protein KCU82_g23, partial [Aureobasidium melanogenum]